MKVLFPPLKKGQGDFRCTDSKSPSVLFSKGEVKGMYELLTERR